MTQAAPIRVLHLIEDLGTGGAERLLYVNLSHLPPQSFTGIVCQLYGRALHWRQPIQDLGYPVLSLNMRSIRDLPRGVFRLLRLLRRHPVDLIHTHLYGANLVGRIAAALGGVPVVSSIHSPDYEPAATRNLSPLKVRTIRWLDRLSCRLGHPSFVAVSQYVRRSAERDLGIPRDRVRVIYNAIDVNAFSRSGDTAAAARRLREDLGLSADDPVILCVARMDPHKGLRHLIEALPALVREFPTVTVVFIGGGPAAVPDALLALADGLQVRSHVHFLGEKTDIRPYLHMCDVFVLPSFFEGMGIALVEAMAMERPCIATSTTAIPEVVAAGKSGLLVAPGDTPALAAAIARLLGDSTLRARFGAEGRRIADERFNVARNIRQLESVYEEVAVRAA